MPIELDPTVTPKLVKITSPTTEVTIQELVNTIRDWEDETPALNYNKVIDAVGKADLGAGVVSGIILTLGNEWRIKFWNGVVQGIIKDGTIVPTSGYNGNPIESTGGNDSIIVLNQIGGVITQVGSGVTEQDKLDIADRVWDESKSGHSGDLKVIADAIDDPDQFKADISSLALQNTLLENEELIKQLREHNISYEFIKATSQISSRNVQVGVVDYMIIKYKNDDDSNWDSPVSTENIYFWYENLGDTNPIYVGEET